MNATELLAEIHEKPVSHGVGMNHLLNVLKEIMPLLDEIKNTVENTSSNIPKASQQLSTVTQATENATMEILDVVDDMGRRIEKVERKLKEHENDLALSSTLVNRIAASVDGFDAEQKKTFAHLHQDLRQLTGHSVKYESIGGLRQELADVRGLSMNIAMSLQVQDITSQQIEGGRHLIESVRTQLANAVGRFDGKELEEPIVEVTKSFDSEAIYSRDGSRQDDADSIIAQFTNNH
jgi:chemotaxis regulatin CheY-phosphate phosphatase CheZ